MCRAPVGLGANLTLTDIFLVFFCKSKENPRREHNYSENGICQVNKDVVF